MSLMNGNVSILVPARNEEEVLPVTLPTILKAAAQLPSPAEVLVFSPASSPAHAAPPVCNPMLRWIVTRRPHKFEALRTGADAARGDKLVLIDADVIVGPRTVANLICPIAEG